MVKPVTYQDHLTVTSLNHLIVISASQVSNSKHMQYKDMVESLFLINGHIPVLVIGEIVIVFQLLLRLQTIQLSIMHAQIS